MKTILVVRKYDDFSRILEKENYKIINLPLIETKPVDDLSDFEAKLASIEKYAGIFITSRQAAKIFRVKLIEKNLDYGGKVYVLGNRSFDILKAENFNLVFNETANTAIEMLEKIALEDLKGKNFLFVRGEKSLRVVPQFLTKTAKVDETVVYRTENIALKAGKINSIRAKLEKREIAAACFFSPSAAESFIEQFGAEVLYQIVIATIGKTTAEYFEMQNLTVNFVSPKSKAKIFAESLSEHLKKYEPDARKIGGET